MRLPKQGGHPTWTGGSLLMFTNLWLATPTLFEEFWGNFKGNLFKPLLLFFYMGFLVPILGVKLDFPAVLYQGLTIYLLIAIGWHGGEELANLQPGSLASASQFMMVGFLTNFCIGMLAYVILRSATKLRRIDAATVAGYYGSDSAGTFVTCMGVLIAAQIKFAAFMPVMLAVMEIPGCLVALYLVSQLRNTGMDALGNMPDEPGYLGQPAPSVPVSDHHGEDLETSTVIRAKKFEATMGLAEVENGHSGEHSTKKTKTFDAKMLHEVFLNPGLYLLFGGIIIGYVGRYQGPKVTADDDKVFSELFHGILCLFLLEMGMTASKKLKDLRAAGFPYIAFGVLAPSVFATIGILVAHTFAYATKNHFDQGTYVMFAVLCGSASYIAVPAVQRMAIPEASPTLPLAASLGLTFSFNVTIGIPLYILIAKTVSNWFGMS